MTFTSRRLRGEKQSVATKVLSSAPMAARVGGALFGFLRKRQEAHQADVRRSRFLKRVAVILVGTFAVVVLFAGTVKALVALKILTPGTIFSVAGTDLPVDEDGFTNLLLLGAGDKNHDGVDLTDSMMVASIDPKTQSIVMLSIPRDLYITESEKMGTGRINQLYRSYKYYLLKTNDDLTPEEASKESLNELARELGYKLGLPIHRVVKVDFTAFVDVVDALGGVDIEVKEDIVDTEYPAGENGGYETFSISAGPQHLDGETALKYARSRHTTSDFDRSARQQQLLQALAKKAEELGVVSSPGKIMSLFQILSEHVETTMTVSEMIGAGKLARSVDRSRIISMQINDRSGLYQPGGFIGAAPAELFNGAAVLLPLAPETGRGGSWSEIRTFMHLLTHYRGVYLAKPRLNILNAGAATGLARSLANELGRYGFTVDETGNASADGKALKDEDKRESSAVVPLLPENGELAGFFGELLQMPLLQEAPPIIPRDMLGQVTILLGVDYTFTMIDELVPVPLPERAASLSSVNADTESSSSL